MRGKIFGGLYRFYFRRVLPRLGALISGNASAYRYLPSSVSKFPSPEALQALFERCGYTDVRFARWTGGIVFAYIALHTYTLRFSGIDLHVYPGASFGKVT